MSCSICLDEITTENPLYACCVCGVKVHKLCYGIEDEIPGWKCSPCHLNKTNFVKCQLCFKKGGALKQTESDKWVHVICALFTSGVVFLNDETMEPIDISKVSKSKRNKLCSFCYSQQGFCSLCANKNCKNRLHVTCAQKYDTLKEEVKKDGKIHFLAFCKDHKPKQSSRRVSSESIKNVVRKKRNNTQNDKTSVENSSWILDAVKLHSTPKNPIKGTTKRQRENKFNL